MLIGTMRLRNFLLLTITLFAFSNVYAMGEGLYLGFMTGPARSSATSNSNTTGKAGLMAQVSTSVSPAPPGGTGWVLNGTTPEVCPASNPNCVFLCNPNGANGNPVGPYCTTVYPKQNLWATRIFLGYNFTNWAAIEGGYDYFSFVHFSSNIKANSKVTKVPTCGRATVKMGGVDVAVKAMAPLWYFGVYGKAGIGYMGISNSLTLTPADTPMNGLPPPCGKTGGSSVSKFVPVFGVGVSYDLSQNWVVDLSANRVGAGGRILKDITYVALSFSYHFVNTYCGQFLCGD